MPPRFAKAALLFMQIILVRIALGKLFWPFIVESHKPLASNIGPEINFAVQLMPLTVA
jgi:hypothetical protein